MSATQDIVAKWLDLRRTGLDLGAPNAAEQDAGYGGRVQRYEHGAIYWHGDIGTHEVHGGILVRYEAARGPGIDLEWGDRRFGFPTSDEERTSDGLHPINYFEWGSIHWTWGGCALSGDLYRHWRQLESTSNPAATWGYPIQDQVRVAGGEAAYFERGCWWIGEASGGQVLPFSISAPRLGRPNIWRTPSLPIMPLPIVIKYEGASTTLDRLLDGTGASLFTALWSDRLLLREVRPPGEQSLVIPIEVRVGALPEEEWFGPIGPVYCFLPAGVQLADRQLYDVVARRSDGRGYVTLAPHAIYSRQEWEDFGFLHATDIHASRRLETVRQHLRDLANSSPAFSHLNDAISADGFHNYNDAFRDLIRYANHLHDRGILDVIVATGDLVDYEFEAGENTNGGGNFAFFKELVLGQHGYPDPAEHGGGASAEELRVPIFTVPGNHDHRRIPYPWILDLEVPGSNPEFNNASPHNLTRAEAIALSPGQRRPNFSTGDARPLVEPDTAIQAYHRELNDELSYVVALGRHRLVMLDSGWDVGLIGNSWWDKFKYYFGGTENQHNFAANNPDQRGFLQEDLRLLEGALREAASGGLVIIGVHAPPLNPKGNERPFYFRETLHAASDSRQVTAFLMRQAPEEFVADRSQPELLWSWALASALDYFEGWSQRTLPTRGAFFKYGDTQRLLDYGTSQSLSDHFVRQCVGAAGSRPVDLVLFGHGHYNVEFRAKSHQGGSDQIDFFSDFYTENPSTYYRCLMLDEKTQPFHGDFSYGTAVKDATLNVLVNVASGAGVKPMPTPVIQSGFRDDLEVRLEAYGQTLNAAADAAGWWAQHRPLLLQSPAVGPLERMQRETLDEHNNKIRPDITFNGFRVGLVRAGTIAELHLVRLRDLLVNGFRMSWEPRLTATPNPVPTGSGLGSTRIAWNTGSGSVGEVYVSEDGGAEKLFAANSDGVQEASWIQTGHTYTFRLYAGRDHRTVLQSRVVRRGLGLTATPNPVPAGRGLGTTAIAWNTGDGAVGEVYVSEDGGAEKLFAANSDGVQEASWIQTGHTYTFRLYAGRDHSRVLQSLVVEGPGARPSGADLTTRWQSRQLTPDRFDG